MKSVLRSLRNTSGCLQFISFRTRERLHHSRWVREIDGIPYLPMSNKLFNAWRNVPSIVPVSRASGKTSQYPSPAVQTFGGPSNLVADFDEVERAMMDHDASVRKVASDAKDSVADIEAKIKELRKTLNKYDKKILKRSQTGGVVGAHPTADEDTLLKDRETIFNTMRGLMDSIGCFGDRIHADKVSRYIMLHCFTEDDVRQWRPPTLTEAQTEELKGYHAGMDKMATHLYPVLKCYSDWIDRNIGFVNHIRVEVQVSAIGVKGALGQQIMGSLLYAVAMDRSAIKHDPTPTLRYVSPDCKLKVYPLADHEAISMMRDGLIRASNIHYSGRRTKQRWTPAVHSSNGYGRLYVCKESMEEENQKYIPSFGLAMAKFRDDMAQNKRKKALVTVASDDAAAVKLPSMESSVGASTTSTTTTALTLKRSSSASSAMDVDDHPVVLIIDDDEEPLVKVPSRKNSAGKRKLSDEPDDMPAAKREKKKQSTQKDAKTDKKKSPLQFRDGKPVFGGARSGGTKGRGGKKSTTAAANLNEGSEGVGTDKRHNNYFSIGSEKVANDRIVNKLEAVRRVNLIFDNHPYEVIGERWKQLFRHRHDSHQQRDMADALLMGLYTLALHWAKTPELLEQCDEPVRFWSIDYGEENVGMAVLYQRSRYAPVIIEFLDTVSLFKDAYLQGGITEEWLSRKYLR